MGLFVARKNGAQIPDHLSLITTVAATTVVWVGVTFLGPQTSRETLVTFFRLVRPAGPGCTPVRAEAGVDTSPDSPAQALVGWVCGCLLLFGAHAIGMIRQPACHAGDDGVDVAEFAGQDGEEFPKESPAATIRPSAVNAARLSRGMVRMPSSMR